VAVVHMAEASGRHPFVTCVGREDEPCRMRRAPSSDLVGLFSCARTGYDGGG
jgi:hypothetical protein